MTGVTRRDRNSALRDAAIRRAALLGAGSDVAWLAEVDANLLRRLGAIPRLQSRLFDLRAGTHGDPAQLPVEAGHLIALPPQIQQQAAIFAGANYHLSAFGPALAQDTIAALTTLFGASAVAFALQHSYLSPPVSTVLSLDDEDVQSFVEADGWAVLGIWVTECGLAPIWIDDWRNRWSGGSMSLIRSAAIAIGAAAAAALWETRAGAGQ